MKGNCPSGGWKGSREELCHEESFVSCLTWDEVKGREQGQPRAGDCSFLLQALAINKDQDLRQIKKEE